jgi:hypothetical protein
MATIDGRRGGKATRHINHSCLPNCGVTEEYWAAAGIVDIDLSFLSFLELYWV